MYIKFLGIGLALFGTYIIYIKRNLQDDSLLLGSGLIIIGLLVLAVGWITKLDAKRK